MSRLRRWLIRHLVGEGRVVLLPEPDGEEVWLITVSRHATVSFKASSLDLKVETPPLSLDRAGPVWGYNGGDRFGTFSGTIGKVQ